MHVKSNCSHSGEDWFVSQAKIYISCKSKFVGYRVVSEVVFGRCRNEGKKKNITRKVIKGRKGKKIGNNGAYNPNFVS